MNWKNETDRIVEFLRETNKEAGTNGYVLGVSGGLDSAIVYKLCVKALGIKKVSPVFIPDTQGIHYIHSEDKVNDLLGQDKIVLYAYIPLSFSENRLSIVGISTDRTYMNEKVVNGNICARTRMTMLYAYANTDNKLVCGTTNQSEYMIGYFTKYGDGGSDVEPIQHLYKTDLFKFAKYLKVPQEIIDAKPSADLWEGQTDEEEIGLTYATVDAALKYIKYGGVNTSEQFFKDICKVQKMIAKSEHKRHMPRSLG